MTLESNLEGTSQFGLLSRQFWESLCNGEAEAACAMGVHGLDAEAAVGVFSFELLDDNDEQLEGASPVVSVSVETPRVTM